MGQSGSGKSTLMNILGCLDLPGSGEYTLDGKNIAGMNEDELAVIRNRKKGCIFQQFNLLPRISVRRKAEMPLTYNGGKPQSEIEQRSERILKAVGRSAQASTTSQIESIGTNLVYVSPGNTSESGVQSAAGSASTLTLFLGGIAGISLAVGGIGIMNIMLTTVTERTHEIGLRKAIGARRQDIMLQDLVELMVLSFIGGLIGVAIGWSIARMMGQIQFSGSTITPVVGLDSVLLATLFSIAIGLFFGIYPATRAARLQRMEALRYE